MKKLLGLVLSVFILMPTFSFAKMIKTDEGNYINENAIYEISPLKDGCRIDYTAGSGVRKYTVKISCEQYIKEKQIEVK